MEPHEASAKERGEDVLFERVRRITGYLVGTLDRFNNAKRAEERDRVKHVTGGDLDDRGCKQKNAISGAAGGKS